MLLVLELTLIYKRIGNFYLLLTYKILQLRPIEKAKVEGPVANILGAENLFKRYLNLDRVKYFQIT